MPLRTLAMLQIFLACSAFATERTYEFKPDNNFSRRCSALGFTGDFVFKVEDPRVGDIIFSGTNASFFVFHDKDQIWRMWISGSWSENIVIDFAKKGTFLQL